MDKQNLIQNLGGRGEKILENNISNKEKVIIKLKGAHGEGLVVTDNKVYVLKWGFMAGSTFGGRCLGFHFNDIMGVELKKGIFIGALEILTPSIQNTQKTYWGAKGGGNSAIESDNIVTFRRNEFSIFQETARLIREMVGNEKVREKSDGTGLEELEKLSQLKDKGIITKEEFETKKRQILGL